MCVALGIGILPLCAQEHPGTIKVKTIDVKGIHELIRQRNGRALFLNVWATWCQPCVEEFPDLVRIRRSFPDSLLDVVAISVDYPDEIESKILPFLASQGAAFPVYVSGVKKEEDFMNALNPSWSGGVPATFIFDKQGQQRAFLFGETSYAVFKAQVDSVIGTQ